MKDYHDLPRAELLKKAEQVLLEYPAESRPEIYFKYTCEKCGTRCALEKANTLFENGECFNCGHEQKIEKGGFLLQFVLGLK
jgi:PHP family Zn ribbon phosphoesterase